MTAANVSISFKIEKATPTGRYVSGWLSVVQKDGEIVEDTQGDRMSMETLRKGVHKYMAGSRVIKKQHQGEQIGEMVEVVMIDDDFAKAHGITHTKRGAWGTAEITDADVRKAVVAGDVNGWSMGGRGKRTAIAKGGVWAGGALAARKRLLGVSIGNNRRILAGEKVAAAPRLRQRNLSPQEFGRKLGRAQHYLSRRATRVRKAFYEAVEKSSDARSRRLASLKSAKRAPAASGARIRFREAARFWRNAEKRGGKN